MEVDGHTLHSLQMKARLATVHTCIWKCVGIHVCMDLKKSISLKFVANFKWIIFISKDTKIKTKEDSFCIGERKRIFQWR